MMEFCYKEKSFVFNGSNGSDEAILLINLGSPLSYCKKDVKKYLTEFLMDENVINIPYPLRYLLVKGIIAPFRTGYSSLKYKDIWDEKYNTFPLIKSSIDVARSLSTISGKVVSVAMRYSEPSIYDSLTALKKLNRIKKLYVFPLYPHYTYSTFKTACDKVKDEMKRIGWQDLELYFSKPFYDNAEYRNILSDSIAPYLEKPFDKLVVSYHGIPLSHLSDSCRFNNGNIFYDDSYHNTECHDGELCYRFNVEQSFRFLIKDLGIDKNKIELVYQSRLGKNKWMKPYIWERVRAWSREGAENILVVCPSFVSDCLETLNEINVYYRDIFLSEGGKSFTYIPCVSIDKRFVNMIDNYEEYEKHES